VIGQLIAFEWRYHTRQPAFIAAAALFFLIGFALTGSSFGPENVAVTAPWLVMEVLAFVSLFSVFAIAIFVANAVIRDTEQRMAEIVFTTPVGRFPYLFGRFAGAFLAGATTLALAPIGMIIASRMPWIDPARAGTLDVTLYLWAFAVMVLPTLVFVTALLFAFAVLTRSPLATYTASIVIYFLYMVCAALTNSPLMAASAPGAGGGALASLLDPFGLTSFFEVTRYWTIAEKNRRFVSLTGILLLNRVVWIAVAGAAWGFAYRVFRFRLLEKARKALPVTGDRLPGVSGSDGNSWPPATGHRQPSHEYARVPQTPSAFSSYWSATRIELGAVARSLPARLLLLLWAGLAAAEIRSEVFDGEYGTVFYPATALIVGVLKAPLMIVGMIIVIYYGSELFWREQRFRMASLVDATPVRGLAMVLAKWTTLVALIGATIATSIAVGVVIQLASGHTDLQPLLYLSLFWFTGFPLALYAAAAVAIHALSPGKYAGLVLVLLFFVATRMLGMLGLEHPLWRYGAGPSVDYSALYGFSDSAAEFARLMLHWSVLAAALLAIAAVAWRRLRDGAPERWRVVAGNARLWAPVLLLALLTGGWVFYGTRDVEPTNTRLQWRADYEKRYRPLANVSQPRIAAVATNVAIYPETRRVQLAGDYTLVNDSSTPIATVHVATRRDAKATRLSIPGARLSTDAAFAVHRFDLARPLQPGERTVLHFELTLEELAEENGTLMMSFLTYPSVGYRASYELTDPKERARRGLGAMSAPELEDPEAASTGESAIDFEATLSTSADQVAITTGRLVREWSQGDRRFFRYRSEAPVRNLFSIASGRYAVAKRQAGGVEVSVAYHPEHSANVEAVLDTAVKTLAYCDREFGAYPHKQMKLVEVPASARFGAYATPDTILLNENRTMLIDLREKTRLDLLGRRVAHEVGHLWWGHTLVPESRSGSTTLVESLAKYTELMVLEQMHGREQVRALLEYELDRYLAGRSGEEQRERTLMTARSQPYIYYSKGAIVLFAIRDLIGEAALNTALRRFIAEERGQANATTLDLLRHLRAVSNDTQFALIDKWLQKIVLYDFRVDSATVQPLPGGRFRVNARVHAASYEATADGTEKEIPLDELIDLAVDDKALPKQRLRSGVNELSFVVNEQPQWLAVDPNILRIDRNRFDNGKSIR
jgi:ABC-2 type transport system permease protein